MTGNDIFFPKHVFNICFRIVRMLCDVLHIGKERDKHCSMVIPILFHPKEKSPFFEELFCRAVWLLAKTRREMKARVDEDHDKVYASKYVILNS